MKVWDRAGIQLATPESAVGHVSAVRHVADCATRPAKFAIGLVVMSSIRISTCSLALQIIFANCLGPDQD